MGVYTIAGDDSHYAKWLEKELKQEFKQPYACMGIMDGSDLIAVTMYHDYVPLHSIQASFASISPRWATRNTLRRMFAYPFRQMSVKIMYAIVAHKNTKNNEIMKRIGFSLDGVIRNYYNEGEDDASWYSMKKNECKWLEA